MTPVESVSVVVPVYNEEQSLEELHRRTRAVLESLGLRFEFIFVNDGSSDQSHAKLVRLREEFPEICVISHRRNHGKSMALMQGFAKASGDVAVMMDADLQDEPENLPVMLAKLGEGFDLVNGWRSERSDTFSKRLVSGIFNLITRRALGIPLHDINCGFKVMRRELYKSLNLRGDLHRLIPAMAQNLGFAVAEVPITHAPRKHGVSKYRLLRHRGLLDIISLTSTLAYRVRPFHIFTEIACVAWVGFGLAGAALTGVLTTCRGDLWLYCVSPLLFFVALACLLVGTMFPVVGLVLDNMLVHYNNEEWRSSLISEVLDSEDE